MNFKDHFSARAGDYAKYRPGYPDALFSHLAGLVRNRGVAWDCATGSGQAALGLARHFGRVIATDASRDQITRAMRHDRIDYRVAPAERSELPSQSVELILVAQALHWFDFERFYGEARRVLRPHGVLAACCYSLLRVSQKVDQVHDRYYREIVGAYWPPERKWIDDCYRSVPFPFEEIDSPRFVMEAEWDLSELVGYLGTWSATVRYAEDHGSNPLERIATDLSESWGDPGRRRRVIWPLTVRAGRTT